MQQILFELDMGAAYRSGELYGINMRYLRQQILMARQSSAVSPYFAVKMPVPDQPALSVEAFLRVDNLYIFGLRNQHGVFYFNDNAGLKLIANQRLLGFSGHYSDLGSFADLVISRSTIATALTQIAHWRLTQEISNRRKGQYGIPQQSGEARHLLMLILMISEAARFFDIEKTVANALDGINNVPLRPLMIQQLTHEWGYLSSQGDYRQVAIRNL